MEATQIATATRPRPPFKSAQALADHRSLLLEENDHDRVVISLCTGSGCRARGAGEVADALRAGINDRGLGDRVTLRLTGCHGFCEGAPLVVVEPQGFLYESVRSRDVSEILERTVVGGEIVERLCHRVNGARSRFESELPFYSKQVRPLLHLNRRIDPTSIDDYIGVGGYGALTRVLGEMSPDEVIAQVTGSGLRGRGGGGYPSGLKWRSCRQAPAADEVRYIVCNADEGDPGAFMDCALMEGNPHAVIEGMIIGAFAIGFPGRPSGYVYIRNEYPVACERLARAIEQAREYGLLGRNILGSGLDFEIEINRGGGAFVCGESTALLASIEGDVGEPRAKHIHTVESGLNDRPTNLNNVETWANVPLIVNRGVEWYTALGTGDVSENPWGGSKGTKIFSLVGKVNNTGLVEVPMGTTLREIVFDIGGGIKDGKQLKAVQTGGPSGGCLPEELLDLPVDFDRLSEAGSMMGSGGMIVMDETTCMVDVARYFLHFLADESCGKCTSCREGLRQLCVIMDRLCSGNGQEGDIELLEVLAETVAATSLCGLGQSATNPLRSTLRYFRNEYEQHLKDRRCAAGVCKDLLHFTIDTESCNGCDACRTMCPSGAIAGAKDEPHVIDPERCIHCGVCADVCPHDAVVIE